MFVNAFRQRFTLARSLITLLAVFTACSGSIAAGDRDRGDEPGREGEPGRDDEGGRGDEGGGVAGAPAACRPESGGAASVLTRLTRQQYRNTLGSLAGRPLDIVDLPEELAISGNYFSNNAAALVD